MTLADDLMKHAHAYENDGKLDAAVNAARIALRDEPLHPYARGLIQRRSPWSWTGFASMPGYLITLNEEKLPPAIVHVPHCYKNIQDFIIHGDALHFVYGTPQRLTHTATLDYSGFSTLRELPKGTKGIVSDPQFEKPRLLRNPDHTILQMDTKSALYAFFQDGTIALENRTQETATPIGTTYSWFYIDDKIAAHRPQEHWNDFSDGTPHAAHPIDDLISIPSHARYLTRNDASTGTPGTLYSGGHHARRFGMEVPITICNILRAEDQRQREEVRKRGLR